MKYTDFQALTVISGGQAQIDGLAAGTYFLFESQEWQKGDYGVNPSQRGEGTELRHKIHYQRKVDPIDSYGITGPAVGYVPEYDLLEADITSDETLTVVREGKDKLEDTKTFSAGPERDGSGPRLTGTSLPGGNNYQPGPNASRDDDVQPDKLKSNSKGQWTI